MHARFPRLCLFLLLVPVQTWAEPARPAPSPAEKAFQQGQTALERDRFEEAIGHFQTSLRLDPRMVEAQLSMAAAHLALGQNTEAVAPMRAYLESRPGHFLVRMPFAEILTRLEQFAEAQLQLDRFVADVQEFPRIADEQLLSSHTKLMELAVHLEDEYGERLHRGIGLYLLALKRVELGGRDSLRLAEELLCKAAGELTLARLQKPNEARPCYYLYDVWRKLGQQHPAERSLREAEERIGFTHVTPAEFRLLHLSAHVRELESLKR